MAASGSALEETIVKYHDKSIADFEMQDMYGTPRQYSEWCYAWCGRRREEASRLCTSCESRFRLDVTDRTSWDEFNDWVMKARDRNIPRVLGYDGTVIWERWL